MSDTNKSKPFSLHAFNTFALLLIAIAVAVQILVIVNAFNPIWVDSLLGSYHLGEYASFAIIPGTLLACSKCIWHAIHMLKSPKARMPAAIYLALALLPYATYNIVVSQIQEPAPVLPTTVSQPQTLVLQNSEFQKGYDLAKQQEPLKDSECEGNEDFVHGCLSYIFERRKTQEEAGKLWAIDNQPGKASQCKGPPYFVKGCRTYFAEHFAVPLFAGHHAYEGMSTEECKVEVNAQYDAAEQLAIENDTPNNAAIIRSQHWEPALEECEKIDRQADNATMQEAYARLKRLMNKLAIGRGISEEEKAAAIADFTTVSKIPDQPMKTAYLTLFASYTKQADSAGKEPAPAYPKISCKAYQAKIDSMGRLDSERIAAMDELKNPDGSIKDNVAYNTINSQRIAALVDWKLYIEGAKAKGCTIKTGAWSVVDPQ